MRSTRTAQSSPSLQSWNTASSGPETRSAYTPHLVSLSVVEVSHLHFMHSRGSIMYIWNAVCVMMFEKLDRMMNCMTKVKWSSVSYSANCMIFWRTVISLSVHSSVFPLFFSGLVVVVVGLWWVLFFFPQGDGYMSFCFVLCKEGSGLFWFPLFVSCLLFFSHMLLHDLFEIIYENFLKLHYIVSLCFSLSRCSCKSPTCSTSSCRSTQTWRKLQTWVLLWKSSSLFIHQSLGQMVWPSPSVE